MLTLLDILILVIRSEAVLPGKASERVDKMSAQVGVDVLRRELGCTWAVHRPVCVVTHNTLSRSGAALPPGYVVCNTPVRLLH